jgi:hypothetical protein
VREAVFAHCRPDMRELCAREKGCGTIDVVTAPDHNGPAPAEALARDAADAHVDPAGALAGPRLPRRERGAFSADDDMSPDIAAAAIRAEDSLAGIREKYSEMSAILYGEDMAKLAAVLRKRLTRDQLADLIVKLDSPA